MGPGYEKMEEHLSKSDIFDGDELRYNIWRKRLINKMKFHGVFYLLETPFKIGDYAENLSETAAEKKIRLEKLAKEQKADALAQEIISRRVSEDIENSLLEFENVSQMIEFLDTQYKRKDVQSLGLIKRELYNLKKENFQNLNALFSKFDKLYKDYEAIVGPQAILNKIFELVYSISDKYKAVKDSFSMMNAAQLDALTIQEVKRMFLNAEIYQKNEEMDRNEFAENSPQAAFVANSKAQYSINENYSQKFSKNRRTCFFCGRRGHFKSECRDYLATLKNEENGKNTRQKFTQERGSHAHLSEGQRFSAILDTGATEHMVDSKDILDDVEELPEPKKICTADSKNFLLATHHGKLRLKSCIGLKKYTNLKLYNVLFVPHLNRNLISVRAFDDVGYKVAFSDRSCTVYNTNDQAILMGTRYNNLYLLDVSLTAEKSYSLLTESQSNLVLWHKRMGHLGISNLKKLVKDNMSTGIDFKNTDKDDKFFCESCVIGKQTSNPFFSCNLPRTSRPLEAVHTDVCGPMSETTFIGQRYYVSFIDDYTHFCVIYLLKNKAEVFKKFLEYESMVGSHFGSKIARLRCDNGGEYISIQFKDFCKSNGIQLEYTVPYTPEQNGVSERMNRTIIDRARTMLIESDLPEMLWGEAVLTANFLTNRSPTSALIDCKTPYEMWYSKKPDLTKLRIFGCVAYAKIPEPKRTKFDPKSKKYRFVGYAVNGYRIWDAETNRIFHARNVVFNESLFQVEKPVENERNLKLKFMPCESLKPARFDSAAQILSENLSLSEEHRDPSDEPNEILENCVENDQNISTADVNSKGVDCPEISNSDNNNELRSTPKRGTRIRMPPKRLEYGLMVDMVENEDIPQNVHLLRKRDDWPLWEIAMKEEMVSIRENDTWTEIDNLPEDRKAVNSKWVFTVKNDNGKPRYKARLVAKGCSQRPGFDYEETFAPVVKITTIRVILSIANYRGYVIHQMDVKCAYLNGNLREEIFMKLPVDIDGKIQLVKLNRSLYGLKQSGKCWNDEFSKQVSEMGFRSCSVDPCLYFNEEIETFMILYVDDILLIGPNNNAIDEIKAKLSEKYKMKDLGPVKRFLNMDIGRIESKKLLWISQENYITKILQKYSMEDCNPVSIPMDPNAIFVENKGPETNFPFRELIGSLQYLTCVSRPDITVAVNILSQFQSNPSNEHWMGLKRILRYLNGTKHFRLNYQGNSSISLEGYADANYAGNSEDRKSTSGYIFQIYGDTISWNTKKQSTISLSSTEAELIALTHAFKEALWLSSLLDEIGINSKPVTIHEDNQPCISLVHENRISQRIKHIDIKYLFIRDHIKNENLKVKWISTENQIADLFTKPLTSISFKRHVGEMKLEGGVEKLI